VFGFTAAAVACIKGYTVRGGPKGVGDAVQASVVITFVLLFFQNMVITTLYFNLIPQKM
jgi:phospholipid/cholesterol/gamma-HCH transport system permease protein